MGTPQPIALVDIAALFEVWSVEPCERRSLLNLIDDLDNAWLDQQHKKTKEPTEQNDDKPASRTAPRIRGGAKGRRAR